MLDVRDRFADRDVFDAGKTDDVARRRFVDIDALQPFEGEQLGDARFLRRAVQFAHRDGVANLHVTVEHAADGDPSEVVARIEVGDQDLQRRLGVPARRRNVVDDRVEQRPEVAPGLVEAQARRAGARARVQHRETELFLRRVQIDEQIVNLVQHFLDARVRPVDLVDDDDRGQPPLERLPEDEPRLRQRTLGRVHEQHDAVHHRQRPLHLAAEIGVAGRVHDINEDVLIVDGGVLGENRNPALALEVGIVHRPLDEAFVGAEDAALT